MYKIYFFVISLLCFFSCQNDSIQNDSISSSLLLDSKTEDSINNMIDKDFNATYNNNSEEIFMNRIIFNQLHPRLSYKEVFFFILGYLLQVTRIFKNLIKIRL